MLVLRSATSFRQPARPVEALVDAGAESTEIAFVDHGRVVAARRVDLGIRDVGLGTPVGLLADIIVRTIGDRHGVDDLARTAAGGVLLAGAGRFHPGLSDRLAGALPIPVHRAASPHTAAVDGAGFAAMSVLRHPAVRGR